MHLKTNKGQNEGLTMGVIGLIVVGALLLISNIVYQSVYTSLAPTPANYSALTSAQQTVWNLNQNITSQTQSAFMLSSSTPIILGAALILSVILGFAAVVSRQ